MTTTSWWTRAGRLLLCLGVAGLIGLLSLSHARDAEILVALPVLPLLIRNPEAAAAGGFALLPFQASLPTGGLSVSPSDALLAIATFGFLSRPVGIPKLIRALRPLAVPLFVYFGVLAVDAVGHPGRGGLTDVIQRIELVIVPMFIAGIATERTLRRSVQGFALVAIAFAVLWPLFLQTSRYGVQKNPAGQFMIDGVIILLVRPGLVRCQNWFVGLLFAGALITQSRGAVAGLLAAMAVLVLVASGNRRRIVGLAVVFGIVFIGVFQIATPGERQRAFRTSADTDNAVKYRDEFQAAARVQRASSPVIGVGLGNYEGVALDGTLTAGGASTADPHNVLLLDGAEGGYPLEAALLALMIGTGVQLLRVGGPKRGPWQMALALQVALFAHGLVDVYWVRNGTTIAWLVTGIALLNPDVLSAFDKVGCSEKLVESGRGLQSASVA